MATVKWSRGERIAPPADFKPTQTRLTARFTLYLDYDHGYLKQVAIGANDPTPTSFYRLIAARPKRRQFKVTARPLQTGLAVVAAVSMLLVLYPLYPGVQYQIQRGVAMTAQNSTALATPPPVAAETNRVVIPKIGVDTAILEGADLKILDKKEGVWHQTGTLQNGNFVLAGHRFRYLPPNTSTFYNLDELTTGDTVIVDWMGQRYVYVVDSLETVPETKTSILAQGGGGSRLTLYTCKDSAQTKRTVVYAHLQP